MRSVDEFPEFLEPLIAELGRSERREGATLYVQGLLISNTNEAGPQTGKALFLGRSLAREFSCRSEALSR